MKDLQILVCTQSKDPRVKTEYPYTPIHTGKSLYPDIELGYLVDNVGDNISDQNANLCEWCAHYWAWKNIKDVKIIGLCHYRRYFDMDMSVDNIEKILKKKDVIVIKQSNRMTSRRERIDDLIRMTSSEDTYLFFDTFLDIYPNYEKELIKYFYNSKDSVPYTMMIANKAVYDQICGFIFPVLLAMQSRRKEHGYSRENRAVAYIGEYILGLAIICLGLKPYRVPLLYVGEDYVSPNIFSKIKHEIKYYVESVGHCIVDICYPLPKHIKCPPATKNGLKNDGIVIKNLK